MTLGLFVPRSFVSPDGPCGYIPRRRLYFSMAGSGLSRVHRTAVFGGQPLTACPGYAFSPASGGGNILQSRTLSQEWERVWGLG